MSFSMSGGAWNYNRFDLYEKKANKDLAAKCDPKGKVTRRDVIAGATGSCEEVEHAGETIDEKKELPDFIKKKMDEKKGKKDDDCGCDHKDDKKDKKESYTITKGDVLEYLMDEGFANNIVSAEVIFEAISDEFLCAIEEQIEESMMNEAAVDNTVARLQKKFNDKNKEKSGSAHRHIPGKQNIGQALYKAGQRKRGEV